MTALVAVKDKWSIRFPVFFEEVQSVERDNLLAGSDGRFIFVLNYLAQ